jgi:hypothetical protein
VAPTITTRSSNAQDNVPNGGASGLGFEGRLSAGQYAALSEDMQRLPGSFRAAAQSQFLAPIEVWLAAYKEAQVRCSEWWWCHTCSSLQEQLVFGSRVLSERAVRDLCIGSVAYAASLWFSLLW